jgi:alkyl hydroperoxide reductase subunit AhpC
MARPLRHSGLHRPICKLYNWTLQSLLGDFAERGVEAIAVSMDTEERAAQAVDEWGLDELCVGYGLSEEDARAWDLYLSESIKEAEPPLFNEPGLFLVKPDGTLYCAATHSMPIGRPDLEALVGSVDFLLDNDYPLRGEVPARQPA